MKFTNLIRKNRFNEEQIVNLREYLFTWEAKLNILKKNIEMKKNLSYERFDNHYVETVTPP